MIVLTLVSIMSGAMIQTLAGNIQYYMDIRKQSFNSQEGKELISQLEQDLKNFTQNPKDIKNFNLLTQKAIEKCNIAQIDTKDKPKINKCIIEKIYYDFPNLSK